MKITSSTGIAGWGEATLENWVVPVATTVEQMAGHLVGQDPRRITHHWQVLTRGGFYRGGPVLGSAVAGIDQALWDLSGHALGAPVHDLLGGATRDRVRIYAHANGLQDRTGNPERAQELVKHGYTMIKIAPDRRTRFIESAEYLDSFVADLTELRTTAGPDVDIAIDLHGRFSVAQSRRALRRIEHLTPCFVEEPLRPEHSALIGDIVRSTIVPIATGERLYHRTEFRPVLEAGVAIVQPDLSHAGGITEVMRIAAQAEVYDAQLAPHCPLGPIALAACLQVDLAVPNVLAQESVIEAHDPHARHGQELLSNPEVLQPVDGHIPRLTEPGLGITVDEDAVRRAVATGPLEAGSPTWTYLDTSFAEW
ncbi:galactonate dehydratase [Oerskovia enterophila]|uniref:galactonate dehydratase n=1 Tax=Oerskovia enterophila TaxID=43678 RepID=UPI003396414C